MRYTLAKREDIANNEEPVKEENKYKDLLVVFENGCILGVDPHNHRTTLIDTIPRSDAEKTLENLSEGVIEFDDFEYNIADHPEYYFLEKGWLLKICRFLEKHKAFSIDAFNLSVNISNNKSEGKQITKNIINKILIGENHVTRIGSYFYVTEAGQMWARQTLGIITKEIEHDRQKVINFVPPLNEMRLHEIAPYKGLNYKQIYEKYPSELMKIKQERSHYADAHLLARLIFWKYVPLAKLAEVLKYLKLNKKEYETQSKAYVDFIKMGREDERSRELEKFAKDRADGKGKNRSSALADESDDHDHDAYAYADQDNLNADADANADTDTDTDLSANQDDIDENDVDHKQNYASKSEDHEKTDDLPDKEYLNPKHDKTIEVFTDVIYLKQRKVDIVRNHFSGNPALFSSAKHVDSLAKMFKTKDKSLQLHMPGDCQNLMAVLLYHHKITRKEVFQYISKHQEYPHNITMKEVIKRMMEIKLM
jgi:hypothetical protein